MPTFITTFSGKHIDPVNPDLTQFSVEDQAHSLARQNRFLGHINREWFSTAQHSVNVSRLCKTELGKKCGLFHEAEEPVVGDPATPFKYLDELSSMRLIAKNIQKIALIKFVGVSNMPAEVKLMDSACFYAECYLLHPELYLIIQKEKDEVGFEAFSDHFDASIFRLQHLVDFVLNETTINMEEMSPIKAEKFYLDEYKLLFEN